VENQSQIRIRINVGQPCAPIEPHALGLETRGQDYGFDGRGDDEGERRCVGHGARFTPCKTNQEILVEALDAYLERVAE
jgi:hypothetical protein